MVSPAVRMVPLEATRPLRQRVLRPYMTLDALAAHEPEGSVAAAVLDGAEIVAVGLIGPEGEPGAWRVRGMATAPEARGHGAGAAIITALADHAIAQGATRLWCNARVPARAFYERAGFVVVSDEFELPQIGPHLVMERIVH